MKKTKNMPLTITLSVEAYRKIGELAPNHKQTETIRTLLEAIVYFRGNYYELLATIGGNRKEPSGR
jgi:hypothetical protein